MGRANEMNANKKAITNTSIVIVVGGLVLLVVMFLRTLPTSPPGQAPTRIEAASNLIQEGDTNETARELLSPEAWYRAECLGWDLYFYGSRSASLAEIVAVRHEVANGEDTVLYVTHFDNDHIRFWDACISEKVFNE
jgi:hypothetical protein